MQIAEATSQKIKNMGLLCAVYVVAIHAWTLGDCKNWLLHQHVIQGITRIAVPFFFAVSGFFLARHIGEDGWWLRELKKRSVSLLLPYLLWTLVLVVGVGMPLSIIADMIAQRPFGTSIYLLHGPDWMHIFGLDLTIEPMLYPLWYVRGLLIFALASPFIWFAVSRMKCWWLLCMFASSALFVHIPDETVRNFFRIGLSFQGLLYFSIGMFLFRIRDFNLSRTTAIGFAVVGIALMSAKIYGFYHSWPCCFEVGELSIPFLMLATWHITPSTNLAPWLVSCAFPIFLLHVVLFRFVDVALKTSRLAECSQALTHGIYFIVGLLGSIAVALSLRRWCPRLANVMFGGR